MKQYWNSCQTGVSVSTNIPCSDRRLRFLFQINIETHLYSFYRTWCTFEYTIASVDGNFVLHLCCS